MSGGLGCAHEVTADSLVEGRVSPVVCTTHMWIDDIAATQATYGACATSFAREVSNIP